MDKKKATRESQESNKADKARKKVTKGTVEEKTLDAKSPEKKQKPKARKEATAEEGSGKKKRGKKDTIEETSEKEKEKEKKMPKSNDMTDEQPSMTEDEKLARKPSLDSIDDEDKKEKKLKRLEKNIAARKANKERIKNRKRNKTEEANKPQKKKKLGERIKEKFKFLTNMFQSKKADKAHVTAMRKQKGKKNLGKIRDGDDGVPTMGDTMATDDDVWIEDPEVLEEKTHRTDLVLVKNNDNDGKLFEEGKRPFWKSKTFKKEVPPPIEKIGSRLLMEMMKEKKQLTDPVPEVDIAYDEDLEVLKAKDAKYFTEDVYVANTIRSIICTMDDDEEAQVPNVPLKPLTMKEPSTYVGYFRHDRRVITIVNPFTKGPPGKPKRTKKKGCSPDNSSASD